MTILQALADRVDDLVFQTIAPPKIRNHDLVQQACYQTHANDLVNMRRAQKASNWGSSLDAARSNIVISFIRSIYKAVEGILFALLANPSAPFTSPIEFGYSIFAYTTIYTGLFVFMILLSIYNLFGGPHLASFLSRQLTGELNLSFVNWGAGSMFNSKGVIDTARTVLGSPPLKLACKEFTSPATEESVAKELSRSRVKVFDLEVARALLLFSAAVYERRPEWVKLAADYRPYAVQLLQKSEELIQDLADQWGVRFVSISDCVNVGSQYAGAFYSDPDKLLEGEEPWICVVFKGTGPDNFSEWLIDATCAQENAADYLWGSCHQGFYTTLFPADGSSVPVLPYRRIMDTTTAIAHLLREKTGHAHNVNVWVTGHSLGAGLASLFYARTLKCPTPGLRLRDAFVYGCPNVGGTEFLSGFEDLMHHPLNEDKTLWRISNAKDIVAVVPPGIASNRANRNSIKAGSLLNYGPMGIEIHMLPHNARAPFYTITDQSQPGTVVVLEEHHDGAFSENTDPTGSNAAALFFGKQRSPWHPLSIMSMVGGLVAPFLSDHAPPEYWLSLAKIAGDERGAYAAKIEKRRAAKYSIPTNDSNGDVEKKKKKKAEIKNKETKA